MNIIPELSLNKHPKDCKNNSLIYAENIKLSGDNSCLQNENSINENSILTEAINGRNVLGIIPCNKELIIFVSNGTSGIDIIRYNENAVGVKTMKYGTLSYDNTTKIIGTFTYNVNNELIIAFSQISNVDTPLKTINLGLFEGDTYETINDDISPLCPEVTIPNIDNMHYINSNAYKGWYYFFIRYKINNSDYTQWYNIGYPIYIGNIEKKNIIKYFQYVTSDGELSTENGQVKGFGCSDYFSNEYEFSNESIKFELFNLDTNYNNYQIGFICAGKSFTKAFKTNDIIKDNIKFILQKDKYEEYNITNLITNYYNYYNVKTLENYKNRLYISNYKEKIVDEDDLISFANNIKLACIEEEYELSDIIKTYNNNTSTGEDEDIKNGTIVAGTSPYYGEIKLIDTDDVILPLNVDLNNFYIKDNNNNKYYATATVDEVSGGNSITDFYTLQFNLNNKVYIFTFKRSRLLTVVLYPIEITSNPFTVNIEISGGSGTEDQLMHLINNNKSYQFRKLNTTLIPNEYYKFYIHFIDKYGITTDGYEITEIQSSQLSPNNKFTIVTNNNLEKLFKVNADGFIDKVSQGEDYAYKTNIYTLNIYNGNLKLPNNIVGYYFSYEKFEYSNTITGFLTLFDANDIATIPGAVSSSKMYFYSSELDSNETIDLNYDKLKINVINPLVNFTNYNKFQTNIKANFFFNGNSIHFGTKLDSHQTYDITNPKLCLGGDSKNGRYGKSSCIELDKISELFSGTYTERTTYIVTLYKEDNYLNKYLNKNKKLIKFTNIYTDLNTSINVKNGLPGFITYNNFLLYDYNGVTLSSEMVAMTPPVSTSGQEYYFLIGGQREAFKPLAYIQIPIYANYLYETKSFKREPEIKTFITSKITDEKANKTAGLFVESVNLIDLFENKYGSADDCCPKLYTNYREDITYSAEFNKTVRRSAVIADESVQNNWRIFETDEYRQISENKGDITNIVGFANTLLVHTEHSLFMFNADQKLRSNIGGDISISNPDIFDTKYVEVFNSELGICGLQDNEAYIHDSFGYYFYDNDGHHIYRFNSNKLEEVDADIVQFLNKYKPTTVRFISDKESNRLLIKFIYNTNKSLILSYNYVSKSFISTHTYNFNNGYHTKNILYILYNNKFYNFNYNNIKNIYYNKFENSSITTTVPSKLAIICNTEYDIIKALEFIQYKLYKIKEKEAGEDYFLSPVEEEHQPYAGDIIRIYNNIVNTGDLDITISTLNNNLDGANYKKPYFDLGNWNLSYLRDINQGTSQDEMARIYGNYFIILFTLGNTNNDLRRIEFESLNCQIIKYR